MAQFGSLILSWVKWPARNPGKTATVIGGLLAAFVSAAFIKDRYFPPKADIESVERQPVAATPLKRGVAAVPRPKKRAVAPKLISQPPRTDAPGVDFTATVYNPSDQPAEFMSLSIKTTAISRTAHKFAKRSATNTGVELMTPAVTYSVPLSCNSASTVVTLRPHFTLRPKDREVVDLRAPPGDYSCNVSFSFTTTEGKTSDVEAVQPESREAIARIVPQ